MKILSIIAQKPSDTGSGVYLKELINSFYGKGIDQEIICATYEDDELHNTDKVRYDNVIFDTKSLPIKIAGMSDVMPYPTIKYSDLARDSYKLKLWKEAFLKEFEEVYKRFKPNIIICHHLYLLTALVVSNYYDSGFSKMKATRIYGICHNTDLRQYRQTDLERDFIKSNIKKLDKVFAPSAEHAKIASEIYDIPFDDIKVIGIGYNDKIFYDMGLRDTIDSYKKILYVGKVSKKKGVLSLIKAVNKLEDSDISLDIVGGAGNQEEYAEIIVESKKSKSTINFRGAMSQVDLSKEYNTHDTFVLPSFSEGIPIVPIEALATGAKVVVSNLPGVKEFYQSHISGAKMCFVDLPKLSNVDDASSEELALYEDRLSKALKDCIEDKKRYKVKVKDISWENIATSILN